MLVDRHAAAIVDDGQAVARLQRHLNPRGMTRHRFVHAVVQHFGRQMVQRALVRAADIHARATTDWFQSFEHFNGGGIIAGGGCGLGCEQVIGHDCKL